MVTTIRKVTGGDHPFYEFACLSTDTKPTSLVPENSICHEIDTGKHFYCSNGEWKELPPKGGSGGGGLPAGFPAEGSANANKFLGFDANGDYTAKDAPSGSGAEKFIVTLTEDDGTWTADKTVAEIMAADEAKQVVVAKFPRDGVYVELPLNSAVEYQGVYGAVFIGFANSGNDNKIVVVSCANQGSGDVISVTLQNIPTSTNEPLVVTLTEENDTWTADKTVAEIVAADEAGKVVVAKYPHSGMNIELPLNTAVSVQGVNGAIFVGIANAGNDNKIVTVQCANEGSGDVITTTEQNIPTSTNEPLVVTLTDGTVAGTLVGDKTFGEVNTAVRAGKNVVMNVDSDTLNYHTSILVISCAISDNTYYIRANIRENLASITGAENDYITVTVGN